MSFFGVTSESQIASSTLKQLEAAGAKVTNKKKTRIYVLAQGTQSCLRDGVRGRRANRNLLRPWIPLSRVLSASVYQFTNGPQA